MQFDKWMESLISNATAIYGMHPLEINHGGQQQRQSIMSQANREQEMEASGADGLATVLGFLAECFTQLVSMVDPDFEFNWSGLDIEDRQEEIKIETQEIATYRTIDEIRQRRGEEPFAQPWSEVPLNSLVFQAAGLTGMAAMNEPPGEGEDVEGTEAENPGAEEEPEPALAKTFPWQGWEEVEL
jgi:hypothetical protein